MLKKMLKYVEIFFPTKQKKCPLKLPAPTWELVMQNVQRDPESSGISSILYFGEIEV